MKKTVCILLSLVLALTGLVGLCVTANASYAVGDTFTFGSYPQTKVTDPSLVSALNAKGSSASWSSLEFYIGDDVHPEMTAMDPTAVYCDVNENGVRYRGVKFAAYRPWNTGLSASTDTSPGSTFYQYQNGYRINTTYWFRYEPLQWRVLDPSTGLILCLSVIDARPFNNYCDRPDWHGEYYNQNGVYTYFASDYAHSSLRTWLNGSFLNTAFSSAEKNKIPATSIQNKGYNTLLGNDSKPQLDADGTTDQVFLPAYDEMIDPAFGFDSVCGHPDALRRRAASDYAKCLGVEVKENGNSNWRLRTPGNDSRDACRVNEEGQSAWTGRTVTNANALGIVPMLCCSDIKPSVPTTVTVTFNANGGSVSPQTKTVTVGEKYGALPTPTLSGWNFAGWYDDNAKRITEDSIVTHMASHTLKAYWTSAGSESVSVTFDPNGGTVSQTAKFVTVGQTYGTLPTPSRWGYTFLGWYDGDVKITDSSTVTRTTAHTLTAHWQGVQVTVSFNANGGTVSVTGKTVRVGDPYGELPLPTRADYTFLGWYAIDDSLVSTTTIVSTFVPHTLIAHWIKTSLLPTVWIDNYVESRTVDYRTTITFNAVVDKAPAGAEVHWIVNGEETAVGDSYTAAEVTKDFTVQAKLMLGSSAIAGSMTETVKVRTGFFARLKAFFRNMFHKLPVITQEYLGIEICE